MAVTLEIPTNAGETASAPAPAPAPTMSATQDRRIARSQRALRRALIELMEERGLSAITVGELCARADLNRGTFYNHFESIDQLLAVFENEIMAGLAPFKDAIGRVSLIDLARSKFSGRPFPFLVELFDYLRGEGDFLHAVLGPGGDVRFGPRVKDSICTDLICGILHKRYTENPTPFVSYYISFYAYAYLGVIMRWLETGMSESSEDMARIAMRLLFIQPGEPIEL